MCHTNMDAANGVFCWVPEAKVEPTRTLHLNELESKSTISMGHVQYKVVPPQWCECWFIIITLYN